jgi:hypothetical protein
MLFVPIGIALSIMNRDRIPAFRAFVFLPLNPQKLFCALLFYLCEVFNHAHVITLSVTSVQTIKILTGHIIAFITKIYFFLPEFSASSFNETVFVAGKTPCAMSYFTSLLRYPSQIGQISLADSTVHSARRDEIRGKFSAVHV